MAKPKKPKKPKKPISISVAKMAKLIDRIEEDPDQPYGALWLAEGIGNCIGSEDSNKQIGEFCDEAISFAKKFKSMKCEDNRLALIDDIEADRNYSYGALYVAEGVGNCINDGDSDEEVSVFCTDIATYAKKFKNIAAKAKE